MKFETDSIKISPLTEKDAGTYEIEAKLADEDELVAYFKFRITIEWALVEKIEQKE